MSVQSVAQPPDLTRRVVVGTAGHIDHGKTLLVKALTGIDCDRWAEEKARGITIDLGFAHLTEGDAQVGFIDVPGHERFVHNALAGLGGIRAMLLVVAADEGVMPQTREHLAICSLLGIPDGLVALTKTDLVSPDLLELAELEVMELLEPTPFAAAKIFRVSSVTGHGLDELKRGLLEIAARGDAPSRGPAPLRLPIDRAFHLRGIGVVVTGTLVSGSVRPGQVLDLLPLGKSVRVRSIQVHERQRDEAVAGERTSLHLTGVGLEELARGLQLVSPGAFEPTMRLCAEFTLVRDAPEPLLQRVPVRFHLYSSEVLGTLRPLAPAQLEPGQTGVVELRLRTPVVAVRGDRFIVRRPSPQATLGGGRCLDPAWRRRRGASLAAALEALAGGDREVLALWVEAEGERGIGAESLARRLGLPPETVIRELDGLVEDGRLLLATEGPGRARRWIALAALERVVARTKRVLKDYFRRNRLAKGMPRAEALNRIVPAAQAQLAQVYLSWLQERKALALDGDLVVLPGRRVELSDAESAVVTALHERFEEAGLLPPSLDQAREELAVDPALFDTALRYLLQIGDLVRLPQGSLVSAASLEALRRELLAGGWQRFSVSQFKERFGLSRKFAIPLLEYLDSAGVTRRAGEDRLVLPTA